jgi:anti-sigma regulatory factor (Ser/Thr protein kinase)
LFQLALGKRPQLDDLHPAGLADNAELLVSELVTNAVAASRSTGSGSAVRLWLLSDTARLLILVQDASPHRPVRADPGPDAEHGRGLLLVEAISDQWGWYAPAPGAAGKVTWALLGMQDKLTGE